MTEDRKPPKVDDAPGLAWRETAKGWEARWRPRADLVKRGLPMMHTRLWIGEGEPSETEKAYISDRCRALQNQMLVWGRGGVSASPVYDGSMGALIDCYKTDPDSTYHDLQFKTRQNYDSVLSVIKADHADDLVSELTGRMFKRWHEAWLPRGVSMAHTLMGTIRTLMTFGATMLECEHCRAAKVTLHDMKFPNIPPRKTHLNAEQAAAHRAESRRRGVPSMALGQAFQFECTFRQKDVIGEWVPIAEGGISNVVTGTEKWIKGIRWDEVDANLVLTHVTSKRKKEVVIDLKLAPMVLEELALEYGEIVTVDPVSKKVTVNRHLLPASGPIIVSEHHGIPWQAYEWRRKWREIARAVGIPDEVQNRDTRAGAITEGFESGASAEDVRKSATHSTLAMTNKYSRGDADAIANVMQLRAANRNRSGT